MGVYPRKLGVYPLVCLGGIPPNWWGIPSNWLGYTPDHLGIPPIIGVYPFEGVNPLGANPPSWEYTLHHWGKPLIIGVYPLEG